MRAGLKELRSLAIKAATITALGFSLANCSGGGSADAQIQMAKAALAKNDAKAAEIHLKNILQKEENLQARVILASIYSEGGDHRSAEKELRKALELGGDRNQLVHLLLDSLLQLGDFQKVITDSRNLAVTEKSAIALTSTIIAKAQLGLNKFEDANVSLQNALVADPNNIPAKVAQISVRIAQGNKKTAALDLDTLIGIDPKSVDAYIAKGDLELEDGNLEAAKKLYIKVAQLAPSNALSRAKLAAIFIDLNDLKAGEEQINELNKVSATSPGTLYLKALINYRQNRLEPARDFVLASLKGAPEYLPSVTLAGNIFLTLGSFESAERYGRLVVEKAPTALQGYRLLGATYLKMNAPERALQAVQPILDKGVQDSALFSIAGEASLKANDAVKAAAYFEKASKLDPNDAAKRTGLALSRMANGDRDKAFADLEKAVEIDSKNYQADFALIMARVRDKQFDKALEAVGRLDSKMEKSPIPPNLRGLIAMAQNKDDEAITNFEAALKIDPQFFAAAANLAAIDTRQNNLPKAKTRYESLLKADPKNAQAFIALAKLAQKTPAGNKEAVEYLRKGKAANPGAIPPVVALAGFYLDTNEPKEALPILQEAITANPSRADLLDLLGSTFIRLNDRPQALDTYEKILRINPKSASTHYRIGELRMQGKDDTGAIQSFNRASELQPEAPEPKIAIATVLVRQGKIAEARKYAVSVRKELASSSAGLALEGDLAMVDNQPTEAAVAFRKALEGEKQVTLGVKLHRALLASNKGGEAQKVLSDWFKSDPADASMRLYAGEYELSQNRWQEALNHYEVVLKQDPKQPVALNNSAWAYSKLGDNAKAVSTAEQAYNVAPSSAPIIDTLGTILLQAGNNSRALELLKQAVVTAPKQSEYRLHLAEALMKTGDKEQAKKELDIVIKEAPPGSIADSAKALAAKL
jgi:cellulose synthase operon protein C